MSNPTTILLAHANLTLPDSLTRRLTLLRAMRAVMTSANPAWRAVNQQIAAIERANKLQAQAQLKFESLTQ